MKNNISYKRLIDLFYHSFLPDIIKSAMDTQIFDTLSEQKMSAEELSNKLSFDENILEPLLSVLKNINLLEEESGKFFSSKEASLYLNNCSDLNQKFSIASYINQQGIFSKLPEVLKGKTFEYDNKMWSNKDTITMMEQQAKTGSIQNIINFIKDTPQFQKAKKMFDLAGGVGYFSLALLKENQNLYADVLDQEKVCQLGREIKKNDPDFNRIAYLPLDLYNLDFPEENYELCLCSHCLYEFSQEDRLPQVLQKINKTLKIGGMFVSNHISDNYLDENATLTTSIVELMTRMMGYPTHTLKEQYLKDSLSKTGFGDISIQKPNGNTAFPYLVLSAIKVKER